MKYLKLFFVLSLLFLSMSLVSAQQQRVVPDAFDLNYPVDGMTVTGWGEYEPWIWEVSANATGYNFKVERLSPTAEVIFDETDIMPYCDENYCYNGFVAADLTGLTDGEYQWDVTAVDGTDTTASTSGPWTFTINSQAVLPSGFGLWYPIEGEVFNANTDFDALHWGFAENATSFDLVITQEGAPEIVNHAGLTPDEDADGLVCVEGECLYHFPESELALIIDGQTYLWEVVAVNDDGFTLSWARGPISFSIDSTAVLPEGVEFWYPNGGQVFNSLADVGNWLWRNANNVVTYTVFLHRDEQEPIELAGLTPAADTDALSCADRMCTFNPPADFDGLEQYNVELRGFSEDGFKNAGTNFTINADAIIPTKATAYNPPFGIVVTSGDNIVKFQWLASENTNTYNVWIGRLEPVEEFFNYWGGLTPEDDEADSLMCTNGICTMAFTSGELPTENGLYEWGLQSANDVTFIQATNHPLQMQFVVDNTGNELVENGVMEFDVDAVNNVPDGWVEKGTGIGDKKLCNKDIDGDTIIDKYKAYIGSCAYRFRGNNTAVLAERENNRLIQKSDLGDVTFDTLSMSGYIKTKNVKENKVAVAVIVFYTDTTLGKDKFMYKVPNATQPWTGFATTYPLQGSISNIKVKLQYKGFDIAGKAFFDNISVIGANTSAASSNLLPLPPASDGTSPGNFRLGN